MIKICLYFRRQRLINQYPLGRYILIELYRGVAILKQVILDHSKYQRYLSLYIRNAK